MKLYLSLANLPSTEKINTIQANFQTAAELVDESKISLSSEERLGRRKMGPQRLAYAMAAARLGTLHTKVMPRDFDPSFFVQVMEAHRSLSNLQTQLSYVMESIDDFIMAMGIDAMTYTKIIHDSLRISNFHNPALDQALIELDDFNRRAAREESETEASSINIASTSTEV